MSVEQWRLLWRRPNPDRAESKQIWTMENQEIWCGEWQKWRRVQTMIEIRRKINRSSQIVQITPGSKLQVTDGCPLCRGETNHNPLDTTSHFQLKQKHVLCPVLAKMDVPMFHNPYPFFCPMTIRLSGDCTFWWERNRWFNDKTSKRRLYLWLISHWRRLRYIKVQTVSVALQITE